MTVSGLIAATTYFMAVYEYKGKVDTSGVNQGTNYKPSTATGNQATGGGTVHGSLVFNASGTFSFTALAGATSVQVECHGDEGGASSNEAGNGGDGSAYGGGGGCRGGEYGEATTSGAGGGVIIPW